MINDPNWTLRFPRTSREVFGSTVEFGRYGNWTAQLFVFAVGLLLGWVLA